MTTNNYIRDSESVTCEMHKAHTKHDGDVKPAGELCDLQEVDVTEPSDWMYNDFWVAPHSPSLTLRLEQGKVEALELGTHPPIVRSGGDTFQIEDSN